MRDADTLRRIHALSIPPAWTHVWICPISHGHIQATGCDARGRKQYRYHERWRVVRDETKFEKMVAFGKALPAIRAVVARDLAQPGLPRTKVVATVVRLLELTCARIGNEEYARQNRSYGLTTLRDRHAEVLGSRVRLRFRGKSGKLHDLEVQDRRVAAIVTKCSELPGHELFQYVDTDGRLVPVESTDVNEYLRRVAGEEMTAKDFRTWSGTILAARALSACEGRASTRRIRQAVGAVAERLGNTPAVCRRSYIHPAVLEAAETGRLAVAMRGRSEERAVIALLERRAVTRKAA